MRASRPLAALLILLPSGAGAFTGNTGGSTAQFLSVGAGARALGMGEAYGAIAEGPEAVYWNPAGLAQLPDAEASYSHAEFLNFFHEDYLAYAHPLRALGVTVGVAGTFFYQDPQSVVTNTNQPAGTFTSHSEAYALAIAKSIPLGEDYPSRDRDFFLRAWDLAGSYRPLERDNDFWTGSLMVGLAVKDIQETIFDRRAQAVAFDGGVLFRPAGFSQLSMSFSFRNAGTKERFINDAERLPFEADFGVAYNFVLERQRWLPSVELALPYYGAPYVKAGLEHSYRMSEDTSLSTRVGYETLSAASLGPISGIVGGIGVCYRRLSLDLAFQPMAVLGDVYRAQVGYRF